MAISIISIQRTGTPGCQHFRVTADVNGRTLQREVHADQVSDVDLDDAVLRIIKYYAVDRGGGLASVVGKVILPDTLQDAP